MFVGTAIRTAKQDSTLLPNVNSSMVGITGNALTATTGRNQDDGNLNFNRGDAGVVSRQGLPDADYSWHDYGAVLSGKAWYDYASAHVGDPWGNIPNGYAAGDAERCRGAGTLEVQRHRRRQGVWLRQQSVDDVSLDWIVGYQKLDWGIRYIVLGGLRDLNPLDIPAALRPGALRHQETRIALPALFARLGFDPADQRRGLLPASLPAQRAERLRHVVFAAGLRLRRLQRHVSRAEPLGRGRLATGVYVNRAGTQSPPIRARPAGAQAHGRHLGDRVRRVRGAVSFALELLQRHQGVRAGDPIYVSGDPGDLNAKYFTEFPEDIRIFGATFDTRFRWGAVFGEFTYRPNQPLQYNSADLIAGFTSLTAPTPLRAQANAVAPGAVFHGWAAIRLGAAASRCHGPGPERTGRGRLESRRRNRLQGRAGSARSDGGALRSFRRLRPGPGKWRVPAAGAATQCSFDGYVSRNAFGYRLRAGLLYANVFEGVDLLPSVFFGQDVSGWWGWRDSGRALARRRLAAGELRQGMDGELAWQPTWGGTYNNLRDRSIAQSNVGYRF